MPRMANRPRALRYTPPCSGFTTCSSLSKTSLIPLRTGKASLWPRKRNPGARARAEASTMTSDSASECFVYITLPGAVSAVTAGKFVQNKTRTGDPLGRFVYGRSYLENPQAVPIDPIELKLAEKTDETVRLNALFSALHD